MEPAIQFENVSKQYRLGQRVNLREALTGLPRRFIAANEPASREGEYLWALRDASFAVHSGEVLGIIGRNGAGKSTILKLIAGITRPSCGQLQVGGKVGSLIELGAGFHPDLTGHENVELNCQLMGMSRREISEQYEAIVEFAELREFMNMPVKRYSSGMYARLAFAVAAHIQMNILLVDEVLSVGDVSFQRKSLEKMLALVKNGKTIVFVSHNLYAIEQMCNRVLWLGHGKVQTIGNARQVIHAYLNDEENRFVGAAERESKTGKGLSIERVQLLDGMSEPVSEFHAGCDLEIQIEYRAIERIEGLRFGLGVANAGGVLFVANMSMDGKSVDALPGTGLLRCRFKKVPLKPGAYQLLGEVWGRAGYDIIVPWAEWGRFRITQSDALQMPLAEEYSVMQVRTAAPVHVPYEWVEGSR